MKGLTKLHPKVPEKLRGTYAGLGTPEVPTTSRASASRSWNCCRFTPRAGRLPAGKEPRELLGLQTISFFTPARRYAAVPDFRLLRVQGDGLPPARAGLEVILDVVYNHTPRATRRGRPSRSRASTTPRTTGCCRTRSANYINDTGTGNTFNLSHPRVLQLVTDSLRYWATEMRVDGFRFDLATILGRGALRLRRGRRLPRHQPPGPVLNSVKLIAEPWDCGPGGYQVGGFPPGWAEWNDRFPRRRARLLEGRRRSCRTWRRGQRLGGQVSTSAAASRGERQLPHRP